MQLENSFTVTAPPERVFAYLLDVNKVVGCVPGAELTEVVDDTTFKGKVKIKVGPITVAYSGTARITGRDDSGHSATLEAEGRETTGQGSARAKALMAVTADGDGSIVRITTDYTVAGRVAQQPEPAVINDDVEGANRPATPAAGSAGRQEEPPQQVTAPPINAVSLFFQVLWTGIRRALGGRPT